MKKYSIILLMASIFFVGAASSQVYKSTDAHIRFVSKTDFEEFEAINHQPTIAFTNKGKVQFRVPVNSFEFEKKLMQTHFQENYMESSKYPNADFKGSVIEPENFNLKEGVQKVKVSGIMKMHGVEKEISATGTIQKNKNEVVMSGNFDVLLSDYKIAIPKNNINQISNTITIHFEAKLEPKKAKKK
jgi:polyisoprenoid-binding protein YceI